LYHGEEAIRYMYRANHVYLLLSSLINIVVGTYRTGVRPGWRGISGLVGSVLMLVSPFALLFAFFFEAPHGLPERVATALGVLMLLIGVLAQWPNRALESGRANEQRAAQHERVGGTGNTTRDEGPPR